MSYLTDHQIFLRQEEFARRLDFQRETARFADPPRRAPAQETRPGQSNYLLG